MPYTLTLKQAAKEVSKTKPTILRALQAGKIKAERQADNSWMIDAKSLKSHYKPEIKENKKSVTQHVTQHSASLGELKALQRELNQKNELLKAAQAERERESVTVADLRRRLDIAEAARDSAEGDFKRAFSELIKLNNLMLTHQNQQNDAQPPAESTIIIQEQPATKTEPKKGFFRRLFS